MPARLDLDTERPAVVRLRVRVRVLRAAPVIADDGTGLSLTVVEDQDEDGQVFASDVDVQDTLTFSTTQGANGSVTIDGVTGEYTYSPNANFNGSDSFVVTVTDDGTGMLTDTTTVNVTVQSVNDEPVAADDTYSVAEDGTLTVTAGMGGSGSGVARDCKCTEHTA